MPSSSDAIDDPRDRHRHRRQQLRDIDERQRAQLNAVAWTASTGRLFVGPENAVVAAVGRVAGERERACRQAAGIEIALRTRSLALGVAEGREWTSGDVC